MYTANSLFLVYCRKASQQYGAFLIPRRNNPRFWELDRRIYRHHRKSAPVHRKCPKSPRKHTAGNGFGRFRTSQKTQRERRCQPYPVCLNISRENGCSFLMRAAGKNTTSFAGSVRGTASRASVPFLFDAHITYQRGDKRDGIRGPQPLLYPPPHPPSPSDGPQTGRWSAREK